MGYKKMNQSLGFADLALASSLKHNRSLKTMEKLDKAINWSRVKEILMNHYTVGTSNEGADAYQTPNWKIKLMTGCLSKSS